MTLGSGGAGRAFSGAVGPGEELDGSADGRGWGGRAGGRPPVGRAPVRRVRAPPRPPASSQPPLCPQLPPPSRCRPAAALAMGAQDRPQCHFDIEINREPGERGEPGRTWTRRGRAGAGGAGSAGRSCGAAAVTSRPTVLRCPSGAFPRMSWLPETRPGGQNGLCRFRSPGIAALLAYSRDVWT